MKKNILLFFLTFFLFIFIFEITFGFWFDENNFGIYMRKHRIINEFYSTKFENQTYDFYYKRNSFGFRGDEIENLNNVKMIFLGGSTGNQRFTPENYTIVEQINQFLLKEGHYYKIYNASIDGATTEGFINFFKFWFPKLNNFKPKIFFIYTGINDISLDYPLKYDLLSDNTKLEQLKDIILNNSIILDKIKKIKWNFFNTPQLRYDHTAIISKGLYDNFHYVDYSEALELYKWKSNYIFLKNKHSKMIERFENRLINLLLYIERYKAIPVFITQIHYDGLSDEKIFILNQFLKEYCKENNLKIIKLDEIYIAKKYEFYDEVHTTLAGSKNIALTLSPQIEKIVKNINFKK